MQEPILLNSTQAAALIGVSARTLYSWDALGKIPQPVRIGVKPFWKKEELIAWIDADCPPRDEWNYCPKKSR